MWYEQREQLWGRRIEKGGVAVGGSQVVDNTSIHPGASWEKTLVSLRVDLVEAPLRMLAAETAEMKCRNWSVSSLAGPCLLEISRWTSFLVFLSVIFPLQAGVNRCHKDLFCWLIFC